MLTDAYIKSLKIGDKKRHADLNGLVLVLRPTKKKLNKVFIFRFQWEKKPQTITLGNYPSLTLANARTIANSHRELLDNEIDPRQKDREENKPKPTFQLIAEQWLHKNQHCWKEVTRNRHHKTLVRDVYPFIANKPIDELTKADLLQIIPISETSARKLLHSSGYKARHTLHGFRALASTVLHEQSNFRTDAIEAQLAHKIQGVRGVYLRADFKNERRDLMN